jgi:membrane protease YdiL (CAAX protease family)
VESGAMFFLKAHEGRNAWWRWLVTIIGTLAFWFAGYIPLLAFVAMESRRLGVSEDSLLGEALPPDIDRNLFLLLSLFPFAVAFGALWFFITRLHKKRLLSVMTGRSRFDWRRVFLGFAVWLVVLTAGNFLILPPEVQYQFDPARFWPLLIIALLMIPIQTTFEEVFFRGYLMQGISLLAKNKIVPLIAVTLLFTAVHFANPEFNTNYLTGILAYLSLSTLFGLTAVLDDGLEVPCGIHAANNLFLVLVLSPVDGSFTTYAVFNATIAELMKYSPQGDIAVAVLMFCVLFYALGWRFSTLAEPTRPGEIADEPAV